MADYYSLMLQQRSQRRAQMMSLLLATLRHRWALEAEQRAAERERSREERAAARQQESEALATIRNVTTLLPNIPNLAAVDPDLAGRYTQLANFLLDRAHKVLGGEVPSLDLENALSPASAEVVATHWVKQIRTPDGQLVTTPMPAEEARKLFIESTRAGSNFIDYAHAQGWQFHAPEVSQGLVMQQGEKAQKPTEKKQEGATSQPAGTPQPATTPFETMTPEEYATYRVKHQQALLKTLKEQGYPMPGEALQRAREAEQLVAGVVEAIGSSHTTNIITAGGSSGVLQTLLSKRAEAISTKLNELQGTIESYLDPETRKVRADKYEDFQRTSEQVRALQAALQNINDQLQQVSRLMRSDISSPARARALAAIGNAEIDTALESLKPYLSLPDGARTFPGIADTFQRLTDLKQVLADPTAIAARHASLSALEGAPKPAHVPDVPDNTIHMLQVMQQVRGLLASKHGAEVLEKLRAKYNWAKAYHTVDELTAALDSLTDDKLMAMYQLVVPAMVHPKPSRKNKFGITEDFSPWDWMNSEFMRELSGRVQEGSPESLEPFLDVSD